MSKEKETKEPKHRPEALRQPQRKDSLSSVLSWAGLQTKPGSPRSTVNSATSSQQSQSQSQPSQGTGTAATVKSRRHSHGPEVKKKARKGSTISRRLSFSNIGGTQEGASAKTRHTKTTSTVDSKPTDSSSVSSGTKTGKSSSTEKINKQTQDTCRPEGHTENSQQKSTSDTGRARSASVSERPTSPKIIPKSILRVASPDGHRPPRRIIAYPAPIPNLQNGQPNSTDPASLPLSPLLQQILPDITEDSAPGSPPTSPISRPLSPGATVRFAKATVHRVEVGPGRRFAPVKRKSKSTITYIAPLDTGTQKHTPKGILTSPTKLRRHVENQKAMGRYWMRTEEEEAQWRAEAAMRAAEEAERYRAEPASPPGPSVLANSPAFHGFLWADGLEALDKLPPVDNLPSLDNLEVEPDEAVDKLETEVSDSDDSDTDSLGSGAKLVQDEEQDEEKEEPTEVEGEKLTQAKTETNNSEKPESQPQADGGLAPMPSTEVKTVAGIQEVKITTAPVATATQEAKTAISRPAIETSSETSSPNLATAKTPSPPKLANKDALTAEKKQLNTVQNPPTASPKAAAAPTQNQAESKKSTTAATETKSAAQAEKTAADTIIQGPLIKVTPTAPTATTTQASVDKKETVPTVIITPSSPPPRRTLSPSPLRRSLPPMSMTLRPTSIYINNTGATVNNSGGGEKQTTTNSTPARASASHLRLSGRRGRRFDTTSSDHGKHEITA